MVRFGLGILAAAGVCSVIGLAACGDSISTTPPGTGGATGAGGGTSPGGASAAGGGTSVGGGAGAPVTGGSDSCVGACCPTVGKCYSDATKGANAPGAECLATHENTPEHIQLRQNWIYAATPVGNASPIVYGILATRSEFPSWDDCNMSGGASGYMQLQDMFLPGGDANIDNHYGYVGNAKFFAKTDLDTTLTNGLCFIDEMWKSDANDPTQGKYALGPDQVGDGNYGTAYLPGMPAPMAQKDASGKIVGWHAGPSKGKRVAKDFDPKTDRVALLAHFAPGGDYATAGFQGLFFYDSAKGYAHVWSPLSYTTVYDNATSHITIPIRETEQKIYTNDPAHPNCVGVYKSDPAVWKDAALVPGGSPNCDNLQDPLKSSWGCKGNSCPPGQDGPAITDGYFLITELEQVYSAALGATLCVTYPLQAAVTTQGFYNDADKDCRTAKFDATKKDGSGLPLGDWCSATNDKATASCHDAWHSHSRRVLSGAVLKDPTQTCTP